MRCSRGLSGIKSAAPAADLSIVAIEWELYKSGGMVTVVRMERGSLARRLPEAAPPAAADACPDDPEDTAEQYLLRSLPAGEAERFEDHYMVCGSCAEALSAAEDYISSIRMAGLRLAKSGLHLL